MKRTLALLLMLLASPVLAAPTGTVLVVGPPVANSATANRSDGTLSSMERFSGIVQQMLVRLGVNFTWVRATDVRTEDLRLGQLVVGRGTGSATVKQFDAVVLCGWDFASTATVRADSLVTSAKLNSGSATGLAKPVAYLLSDFYLLANSFFGFASNACSTGTAPFQALYAEPTDFAYDAMHVPGSTKAFWTGGDYGTFAPRTLTPTGGIRIRLCGNTTNFPYYPEYGRSNPVWSDSLRASGSDTMKVWELLFSNVPASKHALLAVCDGAGGQSDSASGIKMPGEVDPQIILYTLAALDSMTGGKVLDHDLLPIRLGVTVDAAFCRTDNRAGPGILPTDSSVVKGSLDSLAAWNAAGGVPIKLTVGINVDSLQSASGGKTGELAWWRKMGGNVRFSPQVWDGVKAVGNLPNGNTCITQPVDMFGFRRSRFFLSTPPDSNNARWPSSFVTQDCTDGDSSIDTHLKWCNFLMVAAGIKTEERSHTLLPPMDDWVPFGRTNPSDFDSLIFIANRNGYTTLRTDGRSWANLGTTRNGTSGSSMNPWGVSGTGALSYRTRSGYYPSTIRKSVLKVLRHNGYPIAGGTRLVITLTDSIKVAGSLPDSGYVNTGFEELCRTWTGLFVNEDKNSDWWFYYIASGGSKGGITFNQYYVAPKVADNLFPHIDVERPIQYGNIRKFNVADFSGNPSNPARPALLVLKSLKNSFDVINGAAGKTVIEFAWPEDIAP